MILELIAHLVGAVRRDSRLRRIATVAVCIAVCISAGRPAETQQPPSDGVGRRVSGETASQARTAPARASGPGNANVSSHTVPTADAHHPSTPAAATMQIRRDVVGDLSYRFITAQDESSAPAPLPAATGSANLVVLPVSVKPSLGVLEVIDNTRGRVAHLPASAAGITPLTDSDFNMILSVQVPVQSKGRAVTNATVTLTAGGGKAAAPAAEGKEKHATDAGGTGKSYLRSWLLKPSDAGVASFANVPMAVPVTVTVSSGTDTPISQTLTLPTNPPPDGYRWQTIEVPWTDVHSVPLPALPVVAGVAAAPVPPSGGSAAPVQQPAGNPGGELVNTIVSLAILGGVIYGLLWAYKQGHIKKILDNLGIQTQPVAAANGPQGSPFEKAPRTPIQPITEGTSDPLGGQGFAPIAVVDSLATHTGARLVATMGAYAGTIFTLLPAATDIGRDAANPVALPQDTNTSRRHATIQALNGQYTVTDNGSSNGTYVNGVRINGTAPQPLRPGDELQIGMTRFRFEA